MLKPLLDGKHDDELAAALGELARKGPAAAPAAPLVKRALASRSERVRRAAIAALALVANEHARLDELRQDQTELEGLATPWVKPDDRNARVNVDAHGAASLLTALGLHAIQKRDTSRLWFVRLVLAREQHPPPKK